MEVVNSFKDTLCRRTASDSALGTNVVMLCNLPTRHSNEGVIVRFRNNSLGDKRCTSNGGYR